MYLHHDHPERENVPFLGRRPSPAQDLRCGPPRSVTVRHGGLKCDFLIPGEAEICDACAAGTINQNIGLQSSDEQDLKLMIMEDPLL